MAKVKSVGEFEYVEGTGAAKQELVDQVLWALQLHGPFEDYENGGRATALLADWLEEHGVRTTTTLSGVVRDLTTEEWGVYVERDCPATRTYRIALAKGIKPGKVPFPANPFAEMEQESNVVPISGPKKPAAQASKTKPAPESTDAPYDALAIALQITGLAAQLVRGLPAQLGTTREPGTPDWVKAVVEDNERLAEENERLRVALDGAQELVDRLLPTGTSEPEDEATVASS